MEVPYIFVILNTIILGVYWYALDVFRLAEMGVAYLSKLADTPEKINSDITALPTLKNRDLPNTIGFTQQRNRMFSHLAAAGIINSANYIMYPYDGLLYSWMTYILVGAAIIINFDSLRIGTTLRHHRRAIDATCNAYHILTLHNDENNRILDQEAESISKVFEEFIEDLNAATKNADDVITIIDDLKEDDKKNDDNEK